MIETKDGWKCECCGKLISRFKHVAESHEHACKTNPTSHIPKEFQHLSVETTLENFLIKEA
jgi:hypothetical protein